MKLVGILLAAGLGARFGGAKLLAPIPAASHGVSSGTPVGVAACSHLIAALTEVIAVVRPGDSVLRDALAATGAQIVVCERADEGMGTSLACAVAAAAGADGWLVALADMPWIAPHSIVTVAEALRGGAELAAPVFRGERGHPVGFARKYGALLSALTGDEGARALIASNKGALQLLEVDDPGVVRDIDRPDDLHRS